MASWPYNTPEWRELRAAKLRASPWCEPCEKRGKRTRANTVDHCLAINAGGPAFPPLSGLMSMCVSCHGVKTRGVDTVTGKGIGFKGCGPDGFPVDPAHDCYQEGYTPPKEQRLGGKDRRGSVASTKFPGPRRWD